MKKAKSTEKYIKDIYADKLQITTSSNLDKRVLANSMSTLEDLKDEYSANTHPNIWRTIVKSRITKLAAAAVIIIAISFLVVRFSPNKPSDTVKIAQAGKSPAELTTLGTLSFAYRRGGMEMVEKMCDKALTMAGPRPAEISIQDLLENYNGKNPERTKL